MRFRKVIFSSYANHVTSMIVSHTEEMAASLGRPLVYLTSPKIPKEQTALEVLKNNPVSDGLICILSVVEGCQTFQPVKQDNGMLQLRSVMRKCKYYYFYYLDKNFGFMHVKLQTWFPFMIQVYINGRCYTGWNVWEPETFRLFEEISDGRYLVRGFTNHDIRRAVIARDPDSPKERGRMSRTLAKLRAHGLIQKISYSRRYLVTFREKNPAPKG
ncbi:MAG: hypothetical protein HFI41_05725 [Lachnospiraceae bacterium]|nr:hypothetical protein [Lachnospiraceae bacterium]